MPTSEQAAQALNNIVAQPVDKLATIIGILGMVLVVSLVFFGWRLFKYISNNDSPLVKVFREIRDAFNGLKISQVEKSNQVISATQETNKILNEQTVVLQDFTNFQKTNNDTVANLSDEVSDLKTSVTSNTSKIDALRESVDALTDQIRAMLEDKVACADAEERMRNLRDEIVALVTQQQTKRDTSTFPAVSPAVSPVPNVHADDGSGVPAPPAAADGRAA